jgi:mono/diheme cytochrome c family protein
MFLTTGCGRDNEKNAATNAPAATAPPPELDATAAEFRAAGPGDPVAGKLVYEKHCHYCHGKDGRGDGPVGIAVTPHPANFVEDQRRMEKSDEELFKSITNGVVKELGGEEMSMPAWKGTLTPKERRDALAYVRELSKAAADR